MNELQKKTLDMLVAFHKLCVKEKLRYYLIGGSALGAARHQGFIPWDDDIDVGMPRPDYERLKKMSQERFSEKYVFEFPSKDKTFVYPYGKMYDTSTTLIENTRYKTKRGIFIDIFPLDGIGNTYDESVANFRAIDAKVNLLSTKICAWRKGRKLYKNIAMILMRYIPGNSAVKIRKQIDEKSRVFPYETSLYVANCVGNWHEKEIIKREWLGTPRLMAFEGKEVYCPEKVDAYLSALYGDWKKLPPKEKQVSHHDFIAIDLNNSFYIS